MSTKSDNSYNGWANYETWNVALWIGNDECLYQFARDYRHRGYKAFATAMKDFPGEIGRETPDGVSWNDSGLDIDELDAMLSEL